MHTVHARTIRQAACIRPSWKLKRRKQCHRQDPVAQLCEMADLPVENLSLENKPDAAPQRKKYTFKKRDPVEAARLEAERQQRSGKSVRCLSILQNVADMSSLHTCPLLRLHSPPGRGQTRLAVNKGRLRPQPSRV